MRSSLRVRLLALTAALLLAGLTLISAVVSERLERHQLERIDQRLLSLTAIVARASLDETAAPAEADRAALLDPALDLVGAPYLVYLDAGGEITGDVRSSRLGAGSLPSLEALREVPVGGAAVELDAADGSERWRVVARTLAGREGTVLAAAPLAEAEAAVAALRTGSLVGGAVLLVALTAVGWFALGRGLRPLRRIEHTAAAIAGGDLTRRVPAIAPPHTEVGRLADSLNTMLGQLERAFAERAASEARMRDFVWDVSHELRTPLFGIKGSTELYRMGAMPERADVDEVMRRIHRESSRLASLTEDLLLLARLDETPEGQLDRTPMDLRTLAGDARHDVRSLDPSRPVELTGPGGAGPPGPAPVSADEARLRQVVSNLVGNAAAHTPPGTAVRIGVGTDGGRAVLEVADEGPGLAAERAGRVFDRFYRADRSRSREGGAGAGLGLAIARSLARAHDGEVELSTAPGEGACFRLVLPLLEQD